MAVLEIRQLPVLNDNYVYLAHCSDTGKCAVIDPAVSASVIAALDDRGWRADMILNTHHHPDHVGGNEEIKAEYDGCLVYGSVYDQSRIPGLDVALNGGDTVKIGDCEGVVIDVPGHTKGHVAYYFAESKALFCGDTLFALGCGRLFEGTPQQMWESLKKLRDLPDDTRVYCAHEYTNANADFALHLDPKNMMLQRRADDIQALRENGKPTVPSLLGDEKKTNPFLRCDDPAFLKSVGLTGLGAISAFAEVRARKDRF
jgi:hydroxyacylglutathione hydrolase